MKYTYTKTVSYQEVDTTRRWRLYDLENRLLEVAGDVANTLGFGVEQLLPYGYTWILSRIDITMQRLPRHGDKVTFETWIEKNAHMLSTRNYRLYMGEGTQGELIGQVSSIWAVLDLKTRQVVNAFDMPMFADCVDGEALELPRAAKMLPLKEVEAACLSHVKYSDLDYNGHCNSCKYLENMLNVHRPAFLNTPTALRLTIQYSREITEGEGYSVKYSDTGDACQWQILTETGESSVTARLTNLQEQKTNKQE